MATALTIIIAVTNILLLLIPGASDGIPMAAIIGGFVLGIAGLPAAYGLWRCRRWAMIATVVISALNFFSSIPGIAVGPNALAIVMAIVISVVSVATIIAVFTPDARASYV
jgi:uncharacterized membrane protein (DUF2068 family)